MESRTNSLIEHLQAVHSRQRKLIQQLQAENARQLSDLAEIRRERDIFRAEAARCRKGLAELQNRFDEVLSEYHDLKRERGSLSRSTSGSVTRVKTIKRDNSSSITEQDRSINQQATGRTQFFLEARCHGD
ncbi:hypothetical protein SERLA73DRAFT_175058 [Serpula lacrymans var. lacrymans S7.3]|uniref:Uncharacterized protein n=2 Tax=Serpula lacrymans var. lacrymans TaxID=341189 RepID=F8PK97_SERL3|nr:uncharacterized protein SERLADRAFT_456996 [Serpula lacrymans var. lacrymans S7.9]EGO03551.1 hypothetical protein SERLA73DRAFT_175058 [Serpula lacrymans var. lacrymans S7.3]EGO29360.1 hypothetical protein SERLADRAFT_456996 [Serpula lacrymans var. lacrymans S7.9]